MNKLNYTSIAVIIMISLTLGCIGQKKEITKSQTTVSVEKLFDDTSILEIASQNSDVRDFISENPEYEYKITVLTPENITILAEKYPAVYGNLPEKTLYKIDYSQGNRGLLVIVDLEDKKVLKYFRAIGITLG